jgi:hypothetical protein
MSETNQIGKRYECKACGIVLICAKPGAGRIACHGEPLELLTAKPLPSSD